MGLNNPEKSSVLEFFIIISVAFIISFIPFIRIPFSWIMTYFHEISHGIGALITGGSIVKIELHLRGSGLCYSIGGIRFVILQAGYIGAVVWGILIYRMADSMTKKSVNIIAIFFAGLVAVSAILYGKDIITWGILLVIFGFFVSIIKLHKTSFVKLSLKFIGVYVLLDAIRAPLQLIDGRHLGDAAKLSDLTMIPEILWIILWVAIGFYGVWYLWKSSRKA
ncbi:MAG: M50 family metallopeptidase [Desulfotalea sp.]